MATSCTIFVWKIDFFLLQICRKGTVVGPERSSTYNVSSTKGFVDGRVGGGGGGGLKGPLGGI